MKKKIFFSHSCKDEELAQAGWQDCAPEAIPSERLRRLRFAQIVRDTVHDALKCDFEPLLDRECLKGGDNWPVQLNNWLARCDAAVVFLTPEALEKSDWVLKETTILCWRKLLTPTVAVFPVWLFVDQKYLEEHRFKPTEIDRIQSLVKYAGVMTDQEARRIGQQVADDIKIRLGNGDAWPPEEKTDFKRWVKALASFLSSGIGSDREALREACDVLKVEPAGGSEQESLAFALAYGLMLCDSDKRAEAVGILALPLNNKREVLKLIAPTWVPERAAVFVLDEPPANGILIRIAPHEGFGSNTLDLVKDYVQRAYCCRPGSDKQVIDLTTSGEIGPESGAWLLAQVEDRLRKSDIDIEVEETKLPVFGVLNRWSGAEALQQVARRFPTLRCILVSRDNDGWEPSLPWFDADPHFNKRDSAHRQKIKRLLGS